MHLSRIFKLLLVLLRLARLLGLRRIQALAPHYYKAAPAHSKPPPIITSNFIFPYSPSAEHSAVNRKIVGSSPTRGANYCHIFIFICGDILKKPDAEILGVPGGHVGFIVRSDYYIDLIEKFLNKIAI